MAGNRREQLNDAQPVRVDFSRLPVCDFGVLAVAVRVGADGNKLNPTTPATSTTVTAPANSGRRVHRAAAVTSAAVRIISVENAA